MKPALVILAAGASERLGECKATVDLCGRSALERLIDSASRAGEEEIVVVAGRHQAQIEAELARIDPAGNVRLLAHPNWKQGRSGSVALAASAQPQRDLMIAPIDVPLVSSEVFRRLFEAWESAGAPARGWLAPCIEPGPRYGHPVILGRELAAALPGLDPSQPLSVLRSRAAPLLAVEVEDPAILDDLDGPEDLARLRARLGCA